MSFKVIKNPDTDTYIEVTKAVQENDGYCPCLLVKSEETKCPCKEFIFSESEGLCHCGRYKKILVD